jgi:putative SOS response-associated peptidase YedK
MPIILGAEHYLWWLQTRFEPQFLKTLLRPYPAEEMDCYRVSTLVNSARQDSPECVRPG